MTTVPTPSTAARAGQLFRAVAIAEACSWLGLLLGMAVKYLVIGSPVGVQVFGPIHGGLFVAYCAVTVYAARTLRWRVPTTLLALACSIPPLATLWFERRVRRAGRLG